MLPTYIIPSSESQIFFFFWKGGPFRSAAWSHHSASGPEAGIDSGTWADSPFIYCSPATREVHIAAYYYIKQVLITVQLLLRLEKYPHRMNFDRGILELRKQHYKHLSKLLVKLHSL